MRVTTTGRRECTRFPRRGAARVREFTQPGSRQIYVCGIGTIRRQVIVGVGALNRITYSTAKGLNCTDGFPDERSRLGDRQPRTMAGTYARE